MAQWRKLLARMLEDTDPRNYSYDEAAQILTHLGFALAPVSGTSHRKWRHRKTDGTVVVIGLKEQGYGTLKPAYIRDMIKLLREHDLVPHDLE